MHDLLSSFCIQAGLPRGTTLSLVHCSVLWETFKRVHNVDTHVNLYMCTNSGSIKSTPLSKLPGLTNIAPLCLRTEDALVREYNTMH